MDAPNTPTEPEHSASQATPPDGPPPDRPADAPPDRESAEAKRPPKRRRWLWATLIAAAVLIALAALVPTIASTAPVRSRAVGAINEHIRGRIVVGDWSLSWFGTQQARDVQLLDPAGQPIATAQSATLHRSLASLLWDAADLGQIDVDTLALNLHVAPDGGTNVQAALASPHPQPGAPGAEAASRWRGSVRVGRLTGQVSGEQLAEPVRLAGDARVDFAGGAILPETQIAVDTVSGQSRGRLTGRMLGSAESPTVALSLTDTPLGLVNLIPMPSPPPVAVRAGRLSGDASLDRNSVTGEFFVQDARLWIRDTGDVAAIARAQLDLTGTLRDAVTVDLFRLAVDLRDVGEPSAGQAVSLEATGRLSLPLLAAVFGGNGGGAGDALADTDNRLTLDGAFDLARLARAMPGLARRLHLRRDVELHEAPLRLNQMTLNFTSDSVQLVGELHLGKVTGARDGRPVSLSPVDLTAAVVYRPGGLSLPGRGLLVKADWGELRAQGKLVDLNVATVQPIDLGQLSDQFGQFVEMAGYRVEGLLTLNARSSRPSDPAVAWRLTGQFRTQGLKVFREGQSLLEEDQLSADLELARQADRPVARIVRADIAAPRSGLVTLRSAGQLDNSDGRMVLDLRGDYRVNYAALRRLIEPWWPRNLTVAPTDRMLAFELSWPLNAGDQIGLLPWTARADVQVDWSALDVEGLAFEPPGEPLRVTIDKAHVNIPARTLRANGGRVGVAAVVDLSSQTAWLRKPGQGDLYVFNGVALNPAMSGWLVGYLNPMFPDAKSLSGSMDLTLTGFDVPLDREQIGRSGVVQGRFRVTDFAVEGGLVSQVGQALGVIVMGKTGKVFEQAVDLRNGRMHFNNARAQIGTSLLSFDGWVSVAPASRFARTGEDAMQLTMTLRLARSTVEKALSKYLLFGLDVRRDIIDVPLVAPIHGRPGEYRIDQKRLLDALAKHATPPAVENIGKAFKWLLPKGDEE